MEYQFSSPTDLTQPILMITFVRTLVSANNDTSLARRLTNPLGDLGGNITSQSAESRGGRGSAAQAGPPAPSSQGPGRRFRIPD